MSRIRPPTRLEGSIVYVTPPRRTTSPPCRQYGHQAIAIGADSSALDIQVQPAQELAVRARVHDERTPHEDRLGQRVVSVATEHDVEAVDPSSKLHVDRDAVVREQDDQVDFLSIPQLVDQSLDTVFLDAERQVGHEAPGMRHRSVWERLADDAHARAAHVTNRERTKRAVGPVELRHVVRDEVAPEEALLLA